MLEKNKKHPVVDVVGYLLPLEKNKEHPVVDVVGYLLPYSLKGNLRHQRLGAREEQGRTPPRSRPDLRGFVEHVAGANGKRHGRGRKDKKGHCIHDFPLRIRGADDFYQTGRPAFYSVYQAKRRQEAVGVERRQGRVWTVVVQKKIRPNDVKKPLVWNGAKVGCGPSVGRSFFGQTTSRNPLCGTAPR